MRGLGKRTIQISVAIGAIVGLIGCGEEASHVEAGSHDFALSSFNGLTAINGLTAMNGLQLLQRPLRHERPVRRRTGSAPSTAFTA